MYVMAVTSVKYIPKSLCNRNQARKDLQKYTICLTNYDHDFILDEIKRRDTIKYEINISVDETCE